MDFKKLKKTGQVLGVTGMMLFSSFTMNTAKATGQTYKLNSNSPIYMSSTDAKNKRNSKSNYGAGNYYIYKEYDGMLNISRSKNSPGGWINPQGQGSKIKDTASSNTPLGSTKAVSRGVNIRAGKSSTYAKLGYLSKGKSIQGKQEGNWFKFNHNGRTAYVSAKHLDIAGSSSTSPVGSTKALSKGVNIRAGKSSTYAKLGYLSKGKSIQGKQEGNWFKFNHNGRIAYVSAKHLDIAGTSNSTSSSATSNQAKRVTRYTTAGLNVRAGKGTSYRVVGGLSKGSKVIGVREGSWFKINHNGRTAYVSNSYLTSTKPTTSNKKPQVSSTNSSSSKGQAVANKAKQYVGHRYIYGGTSPRGFDCSGLVQYVYKQSAGYNLPRVTGSQEHVGKTVSRHAMKPGDLIFFGRPSFHVGIYVGNGYYVHASTPERGVVMDSVNSRWVQNNMSKVKRIVN